MEEGGGRSHLVFPSLAAPELLLRLLSRRPRGDKGPGLPRPWSAASGAAGEEPREGAGWGAGARGDWEARWLLPLRAPLFCFVVLSS